MLQGYSAAQFNAFCNVGWTHLDVQHIDARRDVLSGNQDIIRPRIHDIRDVRDFISEYGLKADIHDACMGNCKRHLEHIAIKYNLPYGQCVRCIWNDDAFCCRTA